MADWAGAVAACKARFAGNFSATPVVYQNEDPPASPWPPAVVVPWTYFEVLQVDSKLRGVGKPGSQTWLTLGNIFAHVFVPKGYGLEDHLALANPIGEIFRAKTFYNSDPGAKIICGAPAVRGGDSGSDDGNYFGLVVGVPFEFYFIG